MKLLFVRQAKRVLLFLLCASLTQVQKAFFQEFRQSKDNDFLRVVQQQLTVASSLRKAASKEVQSWTVLVVISAATAAAAALMLIGIVFFPLYFPHSVLLSWK